MGRRRQRALPSHVEIPEEGWLNAVFVALALAAYFISFTLYACPYQALLPDLCTTDRARLDLSTIQAFASLVGAALVMVGAPLLLGLLSEGPSAYQTMAIVFACLAFVLTLAPILGIPETKLTTPAPVETTTLWQSLKETLRAPGMAPFLVGNVALFFGFNIVASGVPYFVTVLMGRDASFSGVVLSATFVVAGFAFPFVNRAAKRFGNRRMMLFAGASLAAVMCVVPFMQGPKTGLLVMAIGGIPIAVLLAVPNAMLADIADREARRTGRRREAMFFGAQAFFMKVNMGISSAVLAALLVLGKSTAEPLGVQLVGPATALVLLVAVAAFWRDRWGDAPGADGSGPAVNAVP